MQSDALLMPARSPVKQRLLNAALLLGLLAVFLWQFQIIWPSVAHQQVRLDWPWAAASLLVLLCCSVLDVIIWNRTLGWFAEPLPFREAAPAYLLSYLARYIPGKVGSLLIRAALLRGKRSAVPVLASSLVEIALRVAAALLVFIFTLIGHKIGDLHVLLLAGLCMTPVVLICAHPKIMLPVMNWGLRKVKKPTIDRPLRYRAVLGVVGILIVRFLFFGLAFALLAIALHPAARADIMMLISTAAGSWTVGFLSMLPGGLGSTEAVQKVALTSLLRYPETIAILIFMLGRLLTLIAEGLWALISLAILRMAPASVPASAPSDADCPREITTG